MLDLLGAFLSGVGSVVGAVIAIKRVARYCEKQCDERMQAFRDGLHDRDQP